MKTKDTYFYYGAEVQGIQKFIFETNELKEIVGASELVEKICTSTFQEFLGDAFRQDHVLVMAAGKIRYRFNDEETCRRVVQGFPRKVIESAPGITLSQAVVKSEAGDDYQACATALEQRLRQQRNKQMRSVTTGLMSIRRSRRTGLPLVESTKEGDYIDLSSREKLKQMVGGKDGKTQWKLNDKLFGEGKVGTYDISRIETEDSWIAIVHIDGNGLGQVVQKISHHADDSRKFSQWLNQATIAAARNAYKQLHLPADSKEEPARPLILGGDDFTMICRADIALDFVEYYLDEFERCTGKDLDSTQAYTIGLRELLQRYQVFNRGEKRYMTACAGIAYIKSSYPFYYGYNMAEALCSEAKRESKELSGGMEQLPPSSVMFHRVQSSFIESFSEIVKKELTAGEISFKFGPYYSDPKHLEEYAPQSCFKGTPRWSIQEFKEHVRAIGCIRDGKTVKNNLREWVGLIGSNPGYARQRIERICSLLSGKEQQLIQTITHTQTYKRNPTYDLLVMNALEKKKLSTEER
jgi:hypothetical protein